jgi:hypothetical protein
MAEGSLDRVLADDAARFEGHAGIVNEEVRRADAAHPLRMRQLCRPWAMACFNSPCGEKLVGPRIMSQPPNRYRVVPGRVPDEETE